MDVDEAIGLALDVAERGLIAGEMPIGAVVLAGEEILGEAYTQEQALGLRIVHADLLAMEQADAALGFSRTQEPLTLAVSIEPCLMCLGAAVTLGVKRVWFALESPNDGAVDLLTRWHPPVEQAFFAKPVEVRGGLHHERAQALFAAYASGTGPLGHGLGPGGSPRVGLPIHAQAPRSRIRPRP